MTTFRTLVKMPNVPVEQQITHKDKMLLMGSCFTENIGAKLQAFKFDVQINPFGILYNPMSIVHALENIIAEKHYTADDLHYHKPKYLSFDHHGLFSDKEQTICLQKINEIIGKAHQQLKESRYLVISLGTAFVYEWKKTGQIVANCHKIPNKQFTRRRLSIMKMVQRLGEVVKKMQVFNPDLQVLFTVSPIRHLRMSAIENQCSKSSLIVAIHDLMTQFAHIHYFPAYEIMMDELRDYRFYAQDMTHPSPLAIDYIWQRFKDSYLHEDTAPILADLEKLQKAVAHRSEDEQSPAHQKFRHKQLEKVTALQGRYPFLDFEKEKVHFI